MADAARGDSSSDAAVFSALETAEDAFAKQHPEQTTTGGHCSINWIRTNLFWWRLGGGFAAYKKHSRMSTTFSPCALPK